MPPVVGAGLAYLLGVDVGTLTSKGTLVTVDGLVVAQMHIEHDVSRPFPGWAEHDADRVWWDEVKQIIQSLLKQGGVDPADVVALGVSGLAPVMLPVDGAGRPVRPAILYGIDTRAHNEVDELNRELGLNAPGASPTRQLQSQSVTPKIVWFREHEPRRWSRTARILGATGYVVQRLTGQYVIDSINAEALAPLYDSATAAWDEAMCARLGVPLALLPEVREATDVVGTVTLEAARDTGLMVGTPVICGSMDGLAEYLSSGAIQPGDCCVVFGSTMCVAVLSSEPRTHPLLYAGCSLVPGVYRLSGGMATSGALTRWFRDNFACEERRAERESGTSAYQLLSRAAAGIPPGAGGLVVLPYFDGERTPIFDSDARGLILGLTASHTRHHVYRGLLEGVAYGLRHHLELMAQAGVVPRRILAIGGGTQSELWTRIVSDVTAQCLECVAPPADASVADAYLAGYGTGLFDDFTPLAERWVRIGRSVCPNPDASAVYDRYYGIYRRLYERTAEDMHELTRLSRMPVLAREEVGLAGLD